MITVPCVVCAAPPMEPCVTTGLSHCGSLTVDPYPSTDGVHDERLIRAGLLVVAEPALPPPAPVRPKCAHKRWRVTDQFCVERCANCGQGRYTNPVDYEAMLADPDRERA